ncbi:MAG: zinc ribbon domain-containing protein [Proteobacteria bacterium]|nr:zinc ribbon domain-containing protein [Desulfobulbaceae bacterium]MBU4154159.1 zinc ribbon domain-containing protein [Pseudomonadota bacterium]
MVTDACLLYAAEEHICPHCQSKLTCCTTPPFHVGDGLGWGTDVFFICLNDECSLYQNGWKHVEEQYGQVASFRFMRLPGENQGGPLMVGSNMAFTGSEVNLEEAKAKSDRYQKEKLSLEQLKTCVEEKNLEPVLFLITDEESVLEGREKACSLLKEICDIRCIDPIRNHKFRHTEIGQLADLAIVEILKKTFQRECPHCSEIIKAQATICKHCGK